MLQEGSEQARCPYPGSLVGAHLHLARAPSWSLSTAHNSARNTHLPISQKGKMGSGSSSPCICPRPPAGRRTQVGLGAPPMAALCGVEVCALTPSYAGPLLPRGWGGREAGPTHPLCGLPQCSAQSVTAPAGDLLWYLGTRASVFGEMAPRKTKSVAGGTSARAGYPHSPGLSYSSQQPCQGHHIGLERPQNQVPRQCCGLHVPGPPYLGQARPGLCPQETAHTALG